MIVAETEKELLTHMIRILSDKSYHVISHFNGWRFDEKVIMIRMALHGLLKQYLESMCSISGKNYITMKGSYKSAPIKKTATGEVD